MQFWLNYQFTKYATKHHKALEKPRKNIRFHPDKFVKTNCFNELNNKEAAIGKGNSFGLWNFWRFVLLQDRGAATEACWLAERRVEGGNLLAVQKLREASSDSHQKRSQLSGRCVHALEHKLGGSDVKNKEQLDLLIDDCVKVWVVDKNLATRTYGFKGPVTKLTTSNPLPNHIWFNTDNKVQNKAEADIRAPKYKTLKLDLAQNESFLG